MLAKHLDRHGEQRSFGSIAMRTMLNGRIDRVGRGDIGAVAGRPRRSGRRDFSRFADCARRGGRFASRALPARRHTRVATRSRNPARVTSLRRLLLVKMSVDRFSHHDLPRIARTQKRTVHIRFEYDTDRS